MIPVFQDNTTPGKGNCYSACLASLLELPLASVPNFRAEFPAQEFNERIQEFLARYGLFVLRILMRDADDEPIDHPFIPCVPEGALCIAGGKSPRGSHGHAVVGQIASGCNFELLHDPNREAAVKGVETLWTLDFLVPLNPAQSIKKFQITE